MIQAPVTPTGLEETSPDGRKIYGKRELSTSKRAAQNRAAQVRSTAMIFFHSKNSPFFFSPWEVQVRHEKALTRQIARVSPTKRELHSQTRRASKGLRDITGKSKIRPSGELSTTWIHNQSSIASHRFAEWSPRASRQHWPEPAQEWSIRSTYSDRWIFWPEYWL